jgi:hypothetical protein
MARRTAYRRDPHDGDGPLKPRGTGGSGRVWRRGAANGQNALVEGGACWKRLAAQICEEGGTGSRRRASSAMSGSGRKAAEGVPCLCRGRVPVPLLVVTGLRIIGLMVG